MIKIRPGLNVYNQDRLDDATFVAGFVARHELLEAILDQLRHQAGGGDAIHQILIGSRGMGKSMLLRRLAIAVKKDEALRAAFLPLRFREEQYNVISLDAFWRNCGEALAEWNEAAGRTADAAELDRAIETEAWRDPEQAAEQFLAACRRAGGRALLLLDNLDLILDGIGPQGGWALRRILQERGGPVVIGAATRLLAQGGDRDAPFHEFFRPHFLEPLSQPELLRCLHALAELRQEQGAPVKAVLARQPERLATLYTLTGGNPRVLALIYQLLERAETDTIFGDLEVLLDQVTPFYKARVEEYQTPQQRAVIDAIALAWDPITSGKLAEITGIEVTTISSQLTRLKRDGFVEEVATSGARAGYQISERFLNIWYLMRHGTRRTRQRLRWLAIFLSRLFGAEELDRLAAEARDPARADHWHADYRAAVLEACEMIRQPATAAGGTAGQAGRAAADRAAESSLVAILKAESQGDFSALVAQSDAWLSATSVPHPPSSVALILTIKGFALEKLGRTDEAIAVYDDLLTRFGDEPDTKIRQTVANALFNKGVALGQRGQSEAAIAVYDDLLARFGNGPDMEIRQLVAKAFFNKGVRLGQRGQSEVAIAVYDDLLTRFGDEPDTEIRQTVARVFLNRGVALGQRGQSEAAIAVYDDLLARFGDEPDTEIRQQVAKALFNKGFRLGQRGQSEAAIAVYDDLLSRFGDVLDTEIRQTVARALFNKGFTLGQRGQSEVAIAVYDDLLARFSDEPDTETRQTVARAFLNRGVALGQRGQSEAAIAVYDDLLARFGDEPDTEIRQQAAKALCNKGVTLGQCGQSEAAIAVYDDLLARFGDEPDTEIRQVVAWALMGKGNSLCDLYGDLAAAEATYRRGLEIAGDDLFLKENLAWVLVVGGRIEAAREISEQLDGLDPVGRDLLRAGMALGRDNLGDAFEALRAALETGLDSATSPFFDDLLRLLRLAAGRGHGERMLEWWRTEGFAERYAPIHAAFTAFIKGDRFLLDFAPEIRQPAERLLRRLAPQRETAPPPPATKRRGRPRKRPTS
ncbi:tetratricopeptide repeat protein [Phaeospirillum tilakii]|uniref:Tetratricopeptide repeat protein n=1 Tax=Phaeospirillum tilakii TaxID=741673 RepID=A0ABW5C679_9PROT